MARIVSSIGFAAFILLISITLITALFYFEVIISGNWNCITPGTAVFFLCTAFSNQLFISFVSHLLPTSLGFLFWNEQQQVVELFVFWKRQREMGTVGQRFFTGSALHSVTLSFFFSATAAQVNRKRCRWCWRHNDCWKNNSQLLSSDV